MPMEVRAPPYYYYHYHYHYYYYSYTSTYKFCTMLEGNVVKIFNSTQTFKNVFCLKI
jgi:hypothetical protein